MKNHTLILPTIFLAAALAACSQPSPASTAPTSTAATSTAPAATSNAASAASVETPPTTMTGGAQIANPWQDFATQAEAEAAAGFTITLPARVDDDYAAPLYRAIPGQMLEIQYRDKDADDNDELCLRKAPGAEDISGDYNVYSYTGTLTVGSLQVNVRGKEADDLNTATWQDGDYTYAVVSSDDLDPADLTALISAIQ